MRTEANSQTQGIRTRYGGNTRVVRRQRDLKVSSRSNQSGLVTHALYTAMESVDGGLAKTNIPALEYCSA